MSTDGMSGLKERQHVRVVLGKRFLLHLVALRGEVGLHGRLLLIVELAVLVRVVLREHLGLAGGAAGFPLRAAAIRRGRGDADSCERDTQRERELHLGQHGETANLMWLILHM